MTTSPRPIFSRVWWILGDGFASDSPVSVQAREALFDREGNRSLSLGLLIRRLREPPRPAPLSGERRVPLCCPDRPRPRGELREVSATGGGLPGGQRRLVRGDSGDRGIV